MSKTGNRGSRNRGIWLAGLALAGLMLASCDNKPASTSHVGGVALLVAARTGKAGQQGNSVGAYFCGDLACSLYTRGLKFTASSTRLPEALTLEEKIARNVANLSAFLAKVTG